MKLAEGLEVCLADVPPAELLRRMQHATFWKREWDEPLAWTLADIVLFDRLEAH